MDWIIYILGWLFGWEIFNRFIKVEVSGKYTDTCFIFKIISWSLLWVWINLVIYYCFTY